MYQIKINERDAEWTSLEIPGVTMKVLYRDSVSGAMTVMTRIEPGASIPTHWHSRADETVYVLDGDFVEDGQSYAQGSYFVGKAKTIHGPHSSNGGCTVLTHFSAERDFQTGPIV